MTDQVTATEWVRVGTSVASVEAVDVMPSDYAAGTSPAVWRVTLEASGMARRTSEFTDRTAAVTFAGDVCSALEAVGAARAALNAGTEAAALAQAQIDFEALWA